VDGQLNDPATLPPTKDPPIPIEHEGEWAPDPARALQRGDTSASTAHAGNRTMILGSYKPQPSRSQIQCLDDDANNNNNNLEGSKRFQTLTIETERMRNVKTKVMPILTGATGTMSK
jgi:hypothetical protein